jgi:hypothetical protein
LKSISWDSPFKEEGGKERKKKEGGRKGKDVDNERQVRRLIRKRSRKKR